MGNAEENERLRQEGQKASEYFSKISGFDPSRTQPARPGQPAPAEEAPVVPERPAPPEAPLSEAEKYFKKLLG